ncbi:hypothetical protein JCM10450v2_004690 [Rhodotorula kratochvilovae]
MSAGTTPGITPASGSRTSGFTFSVDLTAVLTPIRCSDVRLDSFEVKNVPARWSLVLKQSSSSTCAPAFELSCTEFPHDSFGANLKDAFVTVEVVLKRQETNRDNDAARLSILTRSLQVPAWAHQLDGSNDLSAWTKNIATTPQDFANLYSVKRKLDKDAAQKWLVNVTVERRFTPSFTQVGSEDAADVAYRCPLLSLNASPHDLRLVFPGVGKDGAELWTKAEFLSATSSYFEDLLASDFAESIPISSKRRRADAPAKAKKATPAAEKEFDDSDDEADALVAPTLASNSTDVQHAYREVVVTQTAFTTYRAVLLYLTTGHLTFAPLASSLLPYNPAARSTRSEHLSRALAADPPLPLPASPKSVYRLSHLLSLPSLSAAALGTAIAYDELRAVVLRYVVRHWEEVRASEGWKDAMARVKRDEVPGGGGVVVEVLQAVAER